MHKPLFIYISFALLFTFVTACNNKHTNTSTEQALLIKNAINTNDVESLRNLSDLPFTYRNQEWESASDGSGFVLGSVNQLYLTTDAEFNNQLNKIIRTIHIEGNEVITQDITLELFSEELKGQTEIWQALKLHLLKRGEGDVEHIVLLGLDKNSNKLKAIYIN